VRFCCVFFLAYAYFLALTTKQNLYPTRSQEQLVKANHQIVTFK